MTCLHPKRILPMNKKQKNKNLSLKLVCYLSFAALVVWLAVYGFRAMDKPYRTVPVTRCSDRETETLSGIIARSETIVYSVYHAVHIDAEEGQRVAARGTVAEAFDSPEALMRANRMEELKREAEELTLLLKAASAENSQQTDREIQNGVRDLRRAVLDRELDDVTDRMQTLHTRAFAAFSPTSRIESRLEECSAEMQTLQEQGAEYAALIPASVSGLFSTTVDGWETLTSDELKNIAPDDLRSLLSENRNEPAYALGKLVSGTRWYYAALMDAEEADRLRSKTSVQVVFGKYYGEKLTMKLEWISAESGGVRTVVLSCDEALGEMLTARKQEAELVLKERNGLRIPRRSLHVDESGNPCVYVRTGLQAEQKGIHILQDYGDYYMVESDTLRVGDEVIVSGKNLYAGKVVN